MYWSASIADFELKTKDHSPSTAARSGTTPVAAAMRCTSERAETTSFGATAFDLAALVSNAMDAAAD